VWHSGNDGTGSGLDADTVDGLDSGSFIRSDANDTFSGTLGGSGSINITGNVAATNFTGNGSGLTGITADNANTLDSIDSASFLRSDVADQKTAGTLTFNDNILLTFGTGNDFELFCDGTNMYFDLNSTGVGSLLLRDGTTTRFTFARSTGNFTATGEITAFSDARIKDNIEVIADPLTKILSIRGVTFTRTDLDDKETRHMGVIAQEVEQYFPEVVHEDENGIKTVNYGAMAGAFIEAFKEQQRQIDELRTIIQKIADK
jgi:3D (Asp-Asp-Asp) domain-containing protein